MFKDPSKKKIRAPPNCQEIHIKDMKRKLRMQRC